MPSWSSFKVRHSSGWIHAGKKPKGSVPKPQPKKVTVYPEPPSEPPPLPPVAVPEPLPVPPPPPVVDPPPPKLS
jgi:hypothetical protein